MTIRRIQRGRNHSYTINGVKAYGVTTAISDGFPKPALSYWAARVVAEAVADTEYDDLAAIHRMGRDAFVNAFKSKPWQQRDNAAVRGTKIHTLAEKLIHGEEIEVDDDDLLAHVENAARFMDDWKVVPVLVEKTCASYAHGYAGTFDLIGRVPDGRTILFDYKTGQSGIWPDHALQLAAYRYADRYLKDDGTEIPMRDIGITDCKAVWVRADGYDVIPLVTDESVFLAFLAVLNVARARQWMQGWRGDAELPGDYPNQIAAMRRTAAGDRA